MFGVAFAHTSDSGRGMSSLDNAGDMSSVRQVNRQRFQASDATSVRIMLCGLVAVCQLPVTCEMQHVCVLPNRQSWPDIVRQGMTAPEYVARVIWCSLQQVGATSQCGLVTALPPATRGVCADITASHLQPSTSLGEP